MKIAIVDADLIGHDKHRFPNLACEKISGYWKEYPPSLISAKIHTEPRAGLRSERL